MPQPPAPRKSRRGAVIAISIVAVLALAAAIAVPLMLKAQREEEERQAAEELAEEQRLEADSVADAFLGEVAAHERVWNESAVSATHGVDMAEVFSRLDHSVDAIGETGMAPGLDIRARELGESCEAQEEAVATFDELAQSTRPTTLPETPATSIAYEQAQATAERNVVLAGAEETFLSEGLELAEQILNHCQIWLTAFDGFAEVNDTYLSERAELAVAEGATHEEDNWTFECDNEGGCFPFAREDRDAWADLTVEAHEEWLQLTTSLFTEGCLPGYEEYCDYEIERTQGELDQAATVMDLYRGPLPSSGQEAHPGYSEAAEEWGDQRLDWSYESNEILREIDVGIDLAPGGRFAGHQEVVIGEWEEQLAELAQAALGEVDHDET